MKHSDPTADPAPLEEQLVAYLDGELTAVERAEIEAIRAALASTSGRRSEAAELLGISRKTLWEKAKHYGLGSDEFLLDTSQRGRAFAGCAEIHRITPSSAAERDLRSRIHPQE